MSYAVRFDVHIGNELKMCSQRVQLLKLLRDQVFHTTEI